MKKTMLYFIAALALVVLAGCGDDYEADTVPKKLFRPVNFAWQVDPDDETVIKATWRTTKASYFLLQISTDNTFTVEVEEVEVERGSTTYLATELVSQEKYYARIKAVSDDPLVADSEFTSAVSATLP